MLILIGPIIQAAAQCCHATLAAYKQVRIPFYVDNDGLKIF